MKFKYAAMIAVFALSLAFLANNATAFYDSGYEGDYVGSYSGMGLTLDGTSFEIDGTVLNMNTADLSPLPLTLWTATGGTSTYRGISDNEGHFAFVETSSLSELTVIAIAGALSSFTFDPCDIAGSIATLESTLRSSLGFFAFLLDGVTLGVGTFSNESGNRIDIAGINSTGEFTESFTTAATPIPGAIWLLGSGLAGLVGLRRKFA